MQLLLSILLFVVLLAALCQADFVEPSIWPQVNPETVFLVPLSITSFFSHQYLCLEPAC